MAIWKKLHMYLLNISNYYQYFALKSIFILLILPLWVPDIPVQSNFLKLYFAQVQCSMRAFAKYFHCVIYATIRLKGNPYYSGIFYAVFAKNITFVNLIVFHKQMLMFIFATSYLKSFTNYKRKYPWHGIVSKLLPLFFSLTIL